MKLINYNYGFNNTFNCSIHGKIIVNQKEWQTILKYLFNPLTRSYYLDKNILKEDIKRTINTKKGKLVNIRISATDKIANKFNLKHYKKGNYMFLIIS